MVKELITINIYIHKLVKVYVCPNPTYFSQAQSRLNIVNNIKYRTFDRHLRQNQFYIQITTKYTRKNVPLLSLNREYVLNVLQHKIKWRLYLPSGRMRVLRFTTESSLYFVECKSDFFLNLNFDGHFDQPSFRIEHGVLMQICSDRTGEINIHQNMTEGCVAKTKVALNHLKYTAL